MTKEKTEITTHRKGELSKDNKKAVLVDTFGGRIHVEWDPQASVTPLGQLPFFIEFLKTAELFEPWVAECPLEYKSPNAPSKRDILGTILLSVLAGHRRYAHISAIRADGVNPELLGMQKTASEDSVRRAFINIDENECAKWQGVHLKRCYHPLLSEPWILDIDTTVKPLYGHQEGAVVGFNTKKPGRPSHVYHTYIMANTRLVLDVEVQAGNRTASKYSRPGLFAFLDSLDRELWPAFLRGDCGFGNEETIRESEERGLPYLFKLRQTRKVRRLLEKLFTEGEWEPAGEGYEGVEATLRLAGWTKERRVVVLRRELREEVAMKNDSPGQQEIMFIETMETVRTYEYVVLVTSLMGEFLTIAQHYRDRADAENPFDELKNQWGWGGFTTRDLKRCRITARNVALIYNWWSLFVRLAVPHKHAEAITSRPLLLHAVAKQTSHGGQKHLTITSSHAKASSVQRILRSLTSFLRSVREDAEQFSWHERWRIILSRIFVHFLRGRLPGTQKLLAFSP